MEEIAVRYARTEHVGSGGEFKFDGILYGRKCLLIKLLLEAMQRLLVPRHDIAGRPLEFINQSVEFHRCFWRDPTPTANEMNLVAFWQSLIDLVYAGLQV